MDSWFDICAEPKLLHAHSGKWILKSVGAEMVGRGASTSSSSRDVLWSRAPTGPCCNANLFLCAGLVHEKMKGLRERRAKPKGPNLCGSQRRLPWIFFHPPVILRLFLLPKGASAHSWCAPPSHPTSHAAVSGRHLSHKSTYTLSTPSSQCWARGRLWSL